MGLLEGLDPELFEKYSRLYCKDYIEQPTKEHWSRDFTSEDYVAALRHMIERENNPPIVLYIHIPYCAQMCMFCVCHFKITHDYGKIRSYLPSLYREMGIVRRIYRELGVSPNVREVHLGGGSPTYLREQEFIDLRWRIQEIADISALDEFTIEIDPRRVGTDRMHFYADNGIDRISFGVQDFDFHVQEAINRVQPPELMRNLLTPEIRRRFVSVNFDLIVGLPNQTESTVRCTINEVVEMQPDRIALSFMHYNPSVHRHQQVMKLNGKLPDHRERKFLHELAVEMLQDEGYVRSGYEHFARPNDEVARAVEAEKVQYNSLGATPGRCDYLIGLGVSSYGRIGKSHYVQQTYDHDDYADAIAEGRFPIYRGHHLTGQDLIRREVIQKLRSVFHVKRREIEEKYCIDFRGFFNREVILLEQFATDGMVELSGDEIRVTNLGKNFTNLICRVFDRHSRGPDFPRDFFDGPRVEL